MILNEQTCQQAWEESYSRRENFVFYPSDEVVRFVSRFLCRRIGLDEVVDVAPGAKGCRVIDVGCGIGRNLVFGTDMGLAMHGIELSEQAVTVARAWLHRKGVADAKTKVEVGDIRAMPWPDGHFAHAISDSVLDSMSFDIARAGVAEIARVTALTGYFYCNFISGDEPARHLDFDGEEIVSTHHEHATIQSYFNRSKIESLLKPFFDILSANLHQVSNPDHNTRHGRWHVVARRR